MGRWLLLYLVFWEFQDWWCLMVSWRSAFLFERQAPSCWELPWKRCASCAKCELPRRMKPLAAPGVLAGDFRGLTSSNKRPRKITNGNGVSMVGNPWLSTCNRVVTPAVGMTWFSLKLCSWGIQVPHRPKAVESLHSGGASIISLKMPGAQDFLLVQQRSKCGWLLNTGVLSFLQ